jgi:hypothetical protein
MYLLEISTWMINGFCVIVTESVGILFFPSQIAPAHVNHSVLPLALGNIPLIGNVSDIPMLNPWNPGNAWIKDGFLPGIVIT